MQGGAKEAHGGFVLVGGSERIVGSSIGPPARNAAWRVNWRHSVFFYSAALCAAAFVRGSPRLCACLPCYLPRPTNSPTRFHTNTHPHPPSTYTPHASFSHNCRLSCDSQYPPKIKMAPGVDIQAFATSQLTLLDKELQAEREETALLTAGAAPITLQRAGLALLNLHVSAQRTGLGGKTILELGLDSAIGSGDLPEHGLRVGDIVAVAEQPKGGERKKEKEGMKLKGVDGVVTKVRRENVSVALDKEDAEAPAGSGRLWLYGSFRK